MINTRLPFAEEIRALCPEPPDQKAFEEVLEKEMENLKKLLRDAGKVGSPGIAVSYGKHDNPLVVSNILQQLQNGGFKLVLEFYESKEPVFGGISNRLRVSIFWRPF